jgi:hypothetical protein
MDPNETTLVPARHRNAVNEVGVIFRGRVMNVIGHKWRPWCAGLAAMAVALPVGAIVAAPAKADISCPSGFVPPSVSPDCYVVTMSQNYMQRHNLNNSGGSAGIISTAHKWCAEMDASGRSIIEEASYINQNGGVLSVADAGYLVGIGAAAYCQSNINKAG